MRILIIGDGKVGYALAERLSNENHDVTVVDNNASALRKAVEKLDVLCIEGSGSSRTALQEADIEKKDIVIAVTSSDEVNMVCALLARKLSKARIIIRIRDPEYTESEEFIKEALGIDLLVNPELSAANEISRVLRFPHAQSIESFVRGRVEIIEYMLEGNACMPNRPLSMVRPDLSANILVCAVQRGEKVFIPDGSTELRMGDRIFVAGEPSQQWAFARLFGMSSQRLRNVMIVGGSRIAFYLADKLCGMGMRTRIIEIDEKRCDELQKTLPDAVVIHGDGTDQELLNLEHVAEMDAFVALTDRDEENIVAGLYARDCKVQRVVAKVVRPYYSRIAEGLPMISPKAIAANRIARYVRSFEDSEGSFVERIYQMADGRLQALEFTVTADSKVVHVPLKSLRLKKGLLVAAIVHNGNVSVPYGDDVIRPKDNVIIITTSEGRFVDINDILLGD